MVAMDRVTAIWHMLDAILDLGCHRMKRVSLAVQLGAALLGENKYHCYGSGQY